MAAVGSLQPGMEALHVQGDYKDAPPPAKVSVVAAAVESLQPAMESLHVQDFKDAAAAPAKGATAVGSLQPGAENLQAQDYKDASMYYGAYPAYAYGGNGVFGSVLSVRCLNLYQQQFIQSPCFFVMICSLWWLGGVLHIPG